MIMSLWMFPSRAMPEWLSWVRVAKEPWDAKRFEGSLSWWGQGTATQRELVDELRRRRAACAALAERGPEAVPPRSVVEPGSVM